MKKLLIALAITSIVALIIRAGEAALSQYDYERSRNQNVSAEELKNDLNSVKQKIADFENQKRQREKRYI